MVDSFPAPVMDDQDDDPSHRIRLLMKLRTAGIRDTAVLSAMESVPPGPKTARQPVRTYTVTFPERYRRGENTLDDPQVAARLALRLALNTAIEALSSASLIAVPRSSPRSSRMSCSSST